MGCFQQPLTTPSLAAPRALCTVYSVVFDLFDAIPFALFHLLRGFSHVTSIIDVSRLGLGLEVRGILKYDVRTPSHPARSLEEK